MCDIDAKRVLGCGKGCEVVGDRADPANPWRNPLHLLQCPAAEDSFKKTLPLMDQQFYRFGFEIDIEAAVPLDLGDIRLGPLHYPVLRLRHGRATFLFFNATSNASLYSGI